MRRTVKPIVLGALGMILKNLEKRLKKLEIRVELKPFKLYHCWDQLEYWAESWRPEKTFCYSESGEKLAKSKIKTATTTIIITSKFSLEKTWTWLRNRKTESLLIVAQNNDIWTNYVKPKIDKALQNSKCRLCDDRDETINHISECKKLVQKRL